MSDPSSSSSRPATCSTHSTTRSRLGARGSVERRDRFHQALSHHLPRWDTVARRRPRTAVVPAALGPLQRPSRQPPSGAACACAGPLVRHRTRARRPAPAALHPTRRGARAGGGHPRRAGRRDGRFQLARVGRAGARLPTAASFPIASLSFRRGCHTAVSRRRPCAASARSARPRPGCAAAQAHGGLRPAGCSRSCVAVLIVVLAGGGEAAARAGPGRSSSMYPGRRQRARTAGLRPSATPAAGCELKSEEGTGVRTHDLGLDEKVKYRTTRPTDGRHYEIPADGKYSGASAGRGACARPRARPRDRLAQPTCGSVRGELRAMFDEDSYQMPSSAREHALPAGRHGLERRSRAQRHRPPASLRPGGRHLGRHWTFRTSTARGSGAGALAGLGNAQTRLHAV